MTIRGLIVKWMKFLQAYTFVIKHKMGVLNQAVNALSRRYSLLATMSKSC